MNKRIDNFDFIDFNDYNQSDTNLLLDLYALVLRKMKWFVLSVVLALSIGVYWVWTTPKTYSRTATILIQPEGTESSSVVESIGLQTGMYLKSDYINDEVGLLQSTRLMEQVVERLNLNINYRTKRGFKLVSLYTSTPFVINVVSNASNVSFTLSATMINDNEVKISDIVCGDVEFTQEYVARFGEEVSTVVGNISLSPTLLLNETFINVPVLISVNTTYNVANAYRARLSVGQIVEQSNLINVSIVDENVNRAEDVINTLIKVYQDDIIDDKNKVLENTTAFIDSRLLIIRQELEDIDAEIEEYKKTNKLTDISSASNLYLQSSSRLDTEGLGVENQLNMAEYMRTYLTDNANISELIPVNVGVSDAGLTRLISEYNALLTERNNLLVNSSEKNPLVIDLQNMLSPMRISILKSVDNLIAGLKIQAENFRRKELETSTKIIDVPTQQKYIVSIQREQKIKEELYLFLLNKREGSELRRIITESNSRVVDSAQGPAGPIAPNKKKVVLMALVIGVFIPCAWLYISGLFDVTIKSNRDLKGSVTVPLLGEIPLSKNVAKNGLVVSEQNKGALEERLKIIRDNINFMSKGDKSKGRVIQLTSFDPGSGKTFLAINLAKSIRELGAKVIVLDMDLRRASLTKRSGFGTNEVGVSQYLSGDISTSDIIRKYELGGLDIDFVSSGALPPNPAELLEGEKPAQLLEQLRANYDYVIMDNPPYSIVVDAAICSRLSDQTIFILRSKLFDKRRLPELQALYDSEKIDGMSVIVNAVDYKNVHYGYGYGYEYDYSYIEQENKSFFKKLFRS